MSTLPEPALRDRRSGLSAQRFAKSCPEPALAVDADDRILALSEAFNETFGYSSDAILGHGLSALVHPDDVATLTRCLAEARLSPAPVKLAHRIRTADGGYRRTDTILDGTIGGSVSVIVHDVTAQAQVVNALTERVDAWEEIFDVLGDGVVVIDEDGRVLAANRAAGEFLGVSSKELGGSIARAQVVVIDESGHPMKRERLPSTRAFATGTTQEEAVAYRRRDGSVVWLYARAIPLRRPGEVRPTRVAIVLEDVIASPVAQPLGPTLPTDLLTPRERDVLAALSDGHDVRAIALQLNISVHTARGHVKKIMQKLGARTQLQAVIAGLRAGLVEVGHSPI